MMEELRKASILLTHLAPRERKQILARFEIEQREQLERMIAEAPEVSRAELVGIVSEYQTWMQRLSVESDQTSGLAETVDSEVNSPADAGLKGQFAACDAETLTERLCDEPATVLCAVMCHLHESTAREVYESLLEDRKAEVVVRLPGQTELKPIVKQELARYLSEPAAGSERVNSPGTALLSRLVGT